MRRFYKVKQLLFFVVLSNLLFTKGLSARILNNWEDEESYKPSPIIFLHGFGPGKPESWNYIKSKLNQYFDDYSLSLTFLETINFNDPNGSVDTYDDGREGWADKTKDKIEEMLNLYRFKGNSLKINFICHSMGGLAAREYITNSGKYSNSALDISKLITIGAPHAGTPLANIKEENISGKYKYILEYPPYEKLQVKLIFESTNDIIMLLRGEIKIDLKGEAIKDMTIGSKFLRALNYDRTWPSNIKKCAIVGRVSDSLNLLFSPYYLNNGEANLLALGDLIVPADSQKGYDVMTYYPEKHWVWRPDEIAEINANHLDELEPKENPEQIIQRILSFLDSATPELGITEPDPNQITEVRETSIHIKGEVYKEYLPADSELTINVRRKEDGLVLSPQTSFLKPSDLWIPNNPDSPVAEFDEVVSFPYIGGGTFLFLNLAGVTKK